MDVLNAKNAGEIFCPAQIFHKLHVQLIFLGLFQIILANIKKAQCLVSIELSVFLWTSLYFRLVPMAGLEPARLASPPPQDGVSTNFTTSAITKSLFFCR